MLMRKKIALVSMLVFTLLLSSAALAGLGMSAGSLDFGEMTRGGSKTMSYSIINSGSDPMKISAKIEGDWEGIASVNPKDAEIPANSNQIMDVTIEMPNGAEVGEEYKGSIFVTSEGVDAEEGVGATIKLAARKYGTALAASEKVSGNLLSSIWPYILVAFVIIIVAVTLIVFVRKE